MPNLVESVLVEPLLSALQEERLVTLCTVDFETGGPNVNAVSWLYAPDETRILVAVTNKSRIVTNIESNNNVVVNLFANESVFAIQAKGELKYKQAEGIPLKLAIVELHIEEVRDVMFYGAKISTEPQFEKNYDLEAAKKLDQEVMEVLKKG